MAIFLFTKAIIEGKPIKVFNHGKMKRDFTYIDDIVEGVVRLADLPPSGGDNWDPNSPQVAKSSAPYEIFNIGNHTPIELNDFISCIEDNVGKKAERVSLPMQDGDVAATSADVKSLCEKTGFKPDTPYTEGIERFVQWYKNYYLN
jgi:UDP-glucuronate 4-epimerase